MKIIQNEVSEYNLVADELLNADGNAYESNSGELYIVTDERQIVNLANGTIWPLEGYVAENMRFRAVDATVSY